MCKHWTEAADADHEPEETVSPVGKGNLYAHICVLMHVRVNLVLLLCF